LRLGCLSGSTQAATQAVECQVLVVSCCAEWSPCKRISSRMLAWHNQRLTVLEATVSLMRRRLVRKFGSLIGLLAILMTALAPAVSQALASGTQPETILSVFCSAGSHTSQTPQAPTDKPFSAPHSAAGHWNACGYCNLAAHSPAAPPCASAYQARTTSGPLHDNALAPPFPPYAPVIAAQPRAPPVFV
jgi:Protein of unknown function (DUF2946)